MFISIVSVAFRLVVNSKGGCIPRRSVCSGHAPHMLNLRHNRKLLHGTQSHCKPIDGSHGARRRNTGLSWTAERCCEEILQTREFRRVQNKNVLFEVIQCVKYLMTHRHLLQDDICFKFHIKQICLYYVSFIKIDNYFWHYHVLLHLFSVNI